MYLQAGSEQVGREGVGGPEHHAEKSLSMCVWSNEDRCCDWSVVLLGQCWSFPKSCCENPVHGASLKGYI